MKKFLNNLSFLVIIGTLLVFLAGCNENEEDPVNDLLGLWTVSDVDIDATIGNESFVDYLVSEGMSEIEAEIYWAIFETLLEDEMDISGTIEIMENNTYTADFEGSTEDGTWKLSADGKTLTFDEGIYEMAFTINSLTSSMLSLSITEVAIEDIDDDPLTQAVEIVVEITLTLEK